MILFLHRRPSRIPTRHFSKFERIIQANRPQLQKTALVILLKLCAMGKSPCFLSRRVVFEKLPCQKPLGRHDRTCFSASWSVVKIVVHGTLEDQESNFCKAFPLRRQILALYRVFYRKRPLYAYMFADRWDRENSANRKMWNSLFVAGVVRWRRRSCQLVFVLFSARSSIFANDRERTECRDLVP